MRVNFSIVILACATAVAAQTPLWNGILAPSRAINWQTAGVMGGIPSANWSQCKTTACQALTAAGASASMTQIVSAMSSANGSSTYVLLPAGTFSLNTGQCFQGYNNVVLRGAGADQTTLKFTGNTWCGAIGESALFGFESNDTTYPNNGLPVAAWTPVAGNPSQIVFSQGLGSLSISTTSSASPTILVVDQCDDGLSGNTSGGNTCTGGTPKDPGGYYNCAEAWNGTNGCAEQGHDAGQRPNRGQVEQVRVVSCSPGCNSSGSVTLTLESPLILPNWNAAASPEAWVIQPFYNVGVEQLAIDGSGTSSNTSISAANSANFWVQGVAIYHSALLGIYVLDAFHNSFVDNYVMDTGQNNSCSGNNCDDYGIKDVNGYRDLIQNNIVQSTRNAIVTGDGPAVADVVAYNYTVNSLDNSDWFYPAILMHSSGDDSQLFEGNISNALQQDIIHGTHMMNTFFRNEAAGWESCATANVCGSNPAKTEPLAAFQDLGFNRFTNAVGNVFGEGIPGTKNVYEMVGSGCSIFNYGTSMPYMIGCGDDTPQDPETLISSMRWMNYDLFTNSTMQCLGSGNPSPSCPGDERGDTDTFYPGSSTPSTALPASFYLSAKPSWWGNLPWPGIGPDVTNGNLGQCSGTPNTPGTFNGLLGTSASQCAGSSLQTYAAGHVNTNPAMLCYLSMGGTLDGAAGGPNASTPIGPALTFNSVKCYGAGVSTPIPTPLPPLSFKVALML